jgi:hypothetical protein
VERKSRLQPIYTEKTDACKFDMNGRKEHGMYQRANFSIKEYDAYVTNGILGEIKSKVPDYTDTDLMINSLDLYYKPYSLWNSGCESSYSTIDAVEVGKSTGDASYFFYILFIVTLIAFL